MSRLQKKPPAHKRGHPTLQNMNFFYFCGSFLPSWIRIRIRIQITDPDPDPMVRLNTDPIRIRIRIHNTEAKYTIMRFFALILNYVHFIASYAQKLCFFKTNFVLATIGGDAFIPHSLRLSRIEFNLLPDILLRRTRLQQAHRVYQCFT
jgi:hypothetical protein